MRMCAVKTDLEAAIFRLTLLQKNRLTLTEKPGRTGSAVTIDFNNCPVTCHGFVRLPEAKVTEESESPVTYSTERRGLA